MTINLDDTSRCPVALDCEVCAGAVVDVVTVETQVGVYCLTICDACREAGKMLRLGWPGTVDRVMRHCEHLGIDADQMAAAMAAESEE